MRLSVLIFCEESAGSMNDNQAIRRLLSKTRIFHCAEFEAGEFLLRCSGSRCSECSTVIGTSTAATPGHIKRSCILFAWSLLCRIVAGETQHKPSYQPCYFCSIAFISMRANRELFSISQRQQDDNGVKGRFGCEGLEASEAFGSVVFFNHHRHTLLGVDLPFRGK